MLIDLLELNRCFGFTLIHFSQIFLLVHDTQCSQFVPTGSYVTKEQFAHEFCVFLNVACIYSLQIGLTEKPAI